MELIQKLLEPCDRTTYGERQREVAAKLGKSVRTVRRLVKKWEEQGLAGLQTTQRADKGKHREEFLARAYAQDLETEELSLDEAKAMSRRIRQAGKEISKAAGVGGAIARWEKFRFNPPPSRQQLEALARVVGVDADRLEQMLPPAGVGMNLEPIRLCAACYVESPCHRIEWQFKVTQGCQHHHLSLLSECPNCGARFKVPALWVDGWCHRCFTPFGEMVESQRTV